jgi:hypothetical protein
VILQAFCERRGELFIPADPTNIRWCYLYRAVDKLGQTVDFLRRRDRSIAAAQAYFRRALATNLNRWPCKEALD